MNHKKWDALQRRIEAGKYHTIDIYMGEALSYMYSKNYKGMSLLLNKVLQEDISRYQWIRDDFPVYNPAHAFGLTIPATEMDYLFEITRHNPQLTIPLLVSRPYHDAIDGKTKFHITARKRVDLVELEHMGLTTLPPGISALKNCVHIAVDSNLLTSLPDDICQMKHLSSIGASYNSLTSLPEDIGNLGKLTHLDLSGNKIVHVPASIFKLTNCTIWLRENPLQNAEKVIQQLEDSGNHVEDADDALWFIKSNSR